MIQRSDLESIRGIGRYFKNEAWHQNLMYRGNFVIALISLLLAFSGCDKQEDLNDNDTNHSGKTGNNNEVVLNETKRYFVAEMPGVLQSMAIDNNHVLYFVSSEVDREAFAKLPPYSNYIPFRHYLSRKTKETNDYEVIDDRFMGGKLSFDRNNQLWCWGGSVVYKMDGNSYKKIIGLPSSEGSFNSLAVDNDNNIWAGGLQTGLYKIDSRLNITHYDSELPTNSMTSIHVDKNNNIWIALWNREVLKIAKNQWVVYDNISSQSIWCLVTDQNGYLWMGTGFFNEANQSLRRFDGTQWETVTPRNEKNEPVTGTVRLVQPVGQRIYVVAEHVRVFPNGGGAEQISNDLLSFDGKKWNKIYEVPDDDTIFDLIADPSRSALWVLTNKGLYKIISN